MLELDRLSVTYGAQPVVHELSLEVRQGEVVALLGANGAGKSSTLRGISRLERTSGRLTFDGVDLERMAPYNVARLGLIHVPEGRRVFSSLSVQENLQMGCTALHGRAPAFSAEDVYDLFPALVPLRRRPGWVLSGGEQQMVVLGRALMAGPRLLLLDEPSLGLAPRVVEMLFAALDQIRQRTPMLLVEQSTRHALALASRAYVMASGRIVLAGTASVIAEGSELLNAYLGQHTLDVGDPTVNDG